MVDHGRVAIVTGASRGIGRAIASRLAQDGFAVIVNYAGSAPEAEDVVRGIEAAGGRAHAVKADVTDPAAMTALFDEATSRFGGADILVNNAGIMRLTTIAEADDKAFDRTVAVNLKGVFNGMREAARRLRDGGRIVSFSSSVVGLYQPRYALYAATKAGVEAGATHEISLACRALPYDDAPSRLRGSGACRSRSWDSILLRLRTRVAPARLSTA